MSKFINEYLSESVSPTPSDAMTCVFTVSPDFHYILDWVPGTNNVLLISGDSGQGFKYTPMIGYLASSLLQGTLPKNYNKYISSFSIHRPGILIP
jgi:glycine/D-amino acid oxidase-like deaminating enzyme